MRSQESRLPGSARRSSAEFGKPLVEFFIHDVIFPPRIAVETQSGKTGEYNCEKIAKKKFPSKRNPEKRSYVSVLKFQPDVMDYGKQVFGDAGEAPTREELATVSKLKLF